MFISAVNTRRSGDLQNLQAIPQILCSGKGLKNFNGLVLTNTTKVYTLGHEDLNGLEAADRIGRVLPTQK